MITLVNGSIQNASNVFVPNGSISFQLNVDATVVGSPFGFVCAEIPIVFQFDATGNILPNAPAAAAQLYSNAELNPQLSSTLLGTYYLVTLYDQNGARINLVPMWWQFPEVAGATVDISQMTPYATVGGNVIFYPTLAALTLQPPTPTTLGGIFSQAGAVGKFLSAINTDGTVSVAGAAGTDTEVQFNQGGVFAGDSRFIWNYTNHSGLIGAALTDLPSDFSPLVPAASQGLAIQALQAGTQYYPFYVIAQSDPAQGSTVGAQAALLFATGNGISGAVGAQNEAYVNPAFGQSITNIANVLGSYNVAISRGAGNVTYISAAAGQTGNQGTGVVANSIGFVVGPSFLFNTGSGSVTNNFDFYAGAQTSATNNYGLYAEDFGAGANNYSLYTAGIGKAFIGGSLTTGHNLSSGFPLTVDCLALSTDTSTAGLVFHMTDSSGFSRILNAHSHPSGAALDMYFAPDIFRINVANGVGVLSVLAGGLEYNTTTGGIFKIAFSSGTNGDLEFDTTTGILQVNTYRENGTHGEACVQGQATEELTLSTGAAFTDTSASLLPANAIIDAVVARITQTISGGSTPTTWEVGDPTTVTRFISTGNALAATTTAVGLNHMKGSVTTDAAGPTQAAAAKVRVTLDQVPGQGKVRITVFYRQYTAPTS